jgi:hypothetical protein
MAKINSIPLMAGDIVITRDGHRVEVTDKK